MTDEDRKLAIQALEEAAKLKDDADRIAYHLYGLTPTKEGEALRRVAQELSQCDRCGRSGAHIVGDVCTACDARTAAHQALYAGK